MLESVRTLSESSAVAAINKAANQAIAYRSDTELYNAADRWAGFRETLVRGAGDCEDIALVKMWLLNAAGIPLGRIHLVLVRSERSPAVHAVLTVELAGKRLVLDNLSDRVWEDVDQPHYQPILSFGVLGEWLHGFTVTNVGADRDRFTVRAQSARPGFGSQPPPDDRPPHQIGTQEISNLTR
jgi:predicted transglutaminase-like cysteine proteinase